VASANLARALIALNRWHNSRVYMKATKTPASRPIQLGSSQTGQDKEHRVPGHARIATRQMDLDPEVWRRIHALEGVCLDLTSWPACQLRRSRNTFRQH